MNVGRGFIPRRGVLGFGEKIPFGDLRRDIKVRPMDLRRDVKFRRTDFWAHVKCGSMR